jgi:hypothetical protein
MFFFFSNKLGCLGSLLFSAKSREAADLPDLKPRSMRDKSLRNLAFMRPL